MKWKFVIWPAVLGALGWAWPVFAVVERPCAEPGQVCGDFMSGSQVWLEGNSSLRRYYLTVGNISAKSDLSTKDSKWETLLSVILNHKGHPLRVALPVKSLKPDDSGMEKTVLEKLKAKEFPDIVFTLGDYVVKPFPGSLTTYALMVSGRLAIAGVEKDVVLEPTLVIGKDGVKIYGSQDVYQKDYGISPYSAAVIMTTDNKIVVHYMIALGLN